MINMKDKLFLTLKGFIFGLANIIPGVSGGTIALTMGIYEDLIKAISNILKEFKNSMSILIPFGIGTALAILSMSKVINFTLDKYPTATILFFVGLILGGIPLIFKKLKVKKQKSINIILSIITFSIVIILAVIGSNTSSVNLSNLNILSYILLFLVGVVAAASMVIPGISGSFMLMLLGFYKPIIKVVADLTNFDNLLHNLLVLIPFGLGVVFGIIFIAKLLEYLFSKYKTLTYYAIFGFLIASVVTLIMKIDFTHSIPELLVGIILLVIGLIIGYKLGDD